MYFRLDLFRIRNNLLVHSLEQQNGAGMQKLDHDKIVSFKKLIL